MDREYIRRRNKKTIRRYPLQQQPSHTICSKHPMNIWYSHTPNQEMQDCQEVQQLSLPPKNMLYYNGKYQGAIGNRNSYDIQSPTAGVWQPSTTGREAVLDNIYAQLGQIKQALNNVQSHTFANPYRQVPAGTVYQQYPSSNHMQSKYQQKAFFNPFQTRSRSSPRNLRNQLQITDPQKSFQRMRSKSAEPLRMQDLQFKRNINRRASVTSFDSDNASLWRPSRRSHKNSITKKLKNEKNKYHNQKPKELQGYDKQSKKSHKRFQKVKNTRSSSPDQTSEVKSNLSKFTDSTKKTKKSRKVKNARNSSPDQMSELRSNLSNFTDSTKKTKKSEKQSSNTNLLLQLLEKMTEVLTKATKSEATLRDRSSSSSREISNKESKRLQSRHNSRQPSIQNSLSLQNTSSISSKKKSSVSNTKKFKNKSVKEEKETESVTVQLKEITRKLDHLKTRPQNKDNQNKFEQVSSMLQSIKKDTKKPQPTARVNYNFLNFFGKKSKTGSKSSHLKEDTKNTGDFRFLSSNAPVFDRKLTMSSTTASPSSLKLAKIFTEKNNLVPSKITRKFKGKRKEVMEKKETMYYDLKQFFKTPIMSWEDPVNSTVSSVRSEALKKSIASTKEKVKQSSSRPTVMTNLSDIFSDRYKEVFSENHNYDFRKSKKI